MSSSYGYAKVSFFITLQRTSPRLTYQMMASINFSVNEIVTTSDAALTYVYIHLKHKIRGEELARGLLRLASTHGVAGSNIYGYDTVDSSSVESRELIEDHPGFKTLVMHEATGNENFHRWVIDGYSGHNCGYNLLKTRLSASRMSQASEGGWAGGPSSASNAGGQSTGQPQPPHPPDHRPKRQRQCSPDRLSGGGSNGGGVDASAFDFMRHLMENADRKHDVMSELREKVALLTVEKRIVEADAGRRVAAAERESSEQREIASTAAVNLREMTRLKEVIMHVCCFLVCCHPCTEGH